MKEILEVILACTGDLTSERMRIWIRCLLIERFGASLFALFGRRVDAREGGSMARFFATVRDFAAKSQRHEAFTVDNVLVTRPEEDAIEVAATSREDAAAYLTALAESWNSEPVR